MSHEPILIGTSLKMYFGYHRTLEWCRRVADVAGRHRAVTEGHVELFVLPSFPTLAPVLEIFAATPVAVGAQHVAAQASGAYTGEVSAQMLAEMGCRYAEVGHAERRRLFHEDDADIAARTGAALAQGLTPVLCVGEAERGDPAAAASECIRQVDAALSGYGQKPDSLVVAYEPHWAIGAAEPASSAHISAVCAELQRHLDAHYGGAVIYGGSAGPGLLTQLAGATRGMFLGRFVHDATAFETIFDEALKLRGVL
ncbi:triose-phosphate isomerase family protein [Kushneria aurantia]|uniref:Triosephosphate isomerase n=1 Tax=Kushneria aurantia TaxID=504092 RepID=A0ABV6G3N6_9GAMM|nr:triose-phosphate isomerase family protein [Kushneria aurantia]